MQKYPDWVLDRLEIVQGQLYADGRPTDRLKPNKNDGYVYVKLSKGNVRRSFPVHRLLWWKATGQFPTTLDHRDNRRNNNRMGNLRECTRAENNRNALKRKDNNSGHKGVYFHTQSGKWRGAVNFDGTRHYVGNHNCPTAAYIKTVKLRKLLHGEFSNLGEHSDC